MKSSITHKRIKMICKIFRGKVHENLTVSKRAQMKKVFCRGKDTKKPHNNASLNIYQLNKALWGR
jgi:hypothetical protein